MTLADKIIALNKDLQFSGELPQDIRMMNPFQDQKIASLSIVFYNKYYSDHNSRDLILGINPGRFGAAVTGIPFTDSKRLTADCSIPYSGIESHEPSSVFIYEMIRAFGGPAKFYSRFYINSVCPLGFTISRKGKEVNYNYYDSKELSFAVYDFILENIKKQIALGMNTDKCFCFGINQNAKFLRKINEEHAFFKKIIPLEHPRYIMQYKSKSKQFYIDKYLDAFSGMY